MYRATPSALPELSMISCFAAMPVAITTTIGTAEPMAQGHEIKRTAIAVHKGRHERVRPIFLSNNPAYRYPNCESSNGKKNNDRYKPSNNTISYLVILWLSSQGLISHFSNLTDGIFAE